VKTKDKVYNSAIRLARCVTVADPELHIKNITTKYTQHNKQKGRVHTFLLDLNRNESIRRIRNSTKVTPIEGKIKEARMKW
jgi:hypothetical protein